MYTVFLLKTNSSRRNRWFTVENVVENKVIHAICVWIKRFPLIHLTFSTVFSTVNRRFLLEDLLLGKKSVYMKNAEERAGFKIFWRKLWKWSLPCQNLQKPLKNCVYYLLCGFLRNWPLALCGRSSEICLWRGRARRLFRIGTRYSESEGTYAGRHVS